MICYITHSLALVELTGRFWEYGFFCLFCGLNFRFRLGIETKIEKEIEKEKEKECVPCEVCLQCVYGKKSIVYQPSRGKRLVSRAMTLRSYRRRDRQINLLLPFPSHFGLFSFLLGLVGPSHLIRIIYSNNI